MCARDLTTKIRTPPWLENAMLFLINSPEIRSAHFCAYFIAIAYSRKRTKRFYIINNHSVFSCASTWFTEWLSIMWLYATYCENRQSTFRMRPYPPKLSNIIMSSSTPNEWSKSSTVFASSEVACKKKLAREFGLPHFLLLNQTHEVWFSFYAQINLQNSDAAFVRKYYVFAHKFPRNSIFSLLRILHCDCLFSQTKSKVLYYKQPLCFLMCEHLIYRVVVYNVAICHLLRE